MAKKDKIQKGIGKIVSAIKKSPLNYLSDLVIVMAVLLWILDSINETIIAAAVTLSSIVLSFQTGTNCYDTTMWSSIGSNISMPLATGVLTWMLKNAGQHWIANKKGERAHEDFPNDEDNGDVENESEEAG